MGNLTSQPQLDEVEQLRKQANDLKQQRNAAFEKSRTCYDKKDHDGAKSWSLKGKDMDKRAKELDAKAGRHPGQTLLAHGPACMLAHFAHARLSTQGCTMEQCCRPALTLDPICSRAGVCQEEREPHR